MKKIFLTLVFLLGCAIMVFAQTTLIATLSHDGLFSQFYGADALTTAYNAAEEGDIITLSPGEFTYSGNFEKGITLRGTGIETSHSTNNLAEPYLTYIKSSINFYSKNSNSVTVVEGIRFSYSVNIYNTPSEKGQGTIKFIKNSMNGVSFSSDYKELPPNSPVVRFYNNIIGSVSVGPYTKPDCKFYNCFIWNPSGNTNEENSVTFYNCVVSYYDNRIMYAYNINFYNCIFNYTASSHSFGSLPTSASCYHCLSNRNSGLFNSIFYKQNNKYSDSISNIFKTFNGDGNTWHETFELTETAKVTYLGNDGTEIGMQGGVYPYNVTVQYPIITDLSSDAQTTKDGKLNVTIEVDGK